MPSVLGDSAPHGHIWVFSKEISTELNSPLYCKTAKKQQQGVKYFLKEQEIAGIADSPVMMISS